MSESFKELTELPDDEVVRRHDDHAKGTGVFSEHYMDELNRRHQKRQTDSMLRFTKWITFMTIVVTLATLVNVGLTVWVLLNGDHL